jgi:uncharacterized protein YoxC
LALLESSATLMPHVGRLVMASLLQAGGLVRDTVVTVQATSRGWTLWVDTLTSIASVIIALALIAIAIALIPAAWNARKVNRKVNAVLGQVMNDVAPLIKHGHAITENLNYITSSMRADAEQLTRAITSANRRLDRAADRAEARINDFNALLKVMQEEAEDLFIGTAATVRGVQVGAETLRGFREDEEWEHEEEGLEIRTERVVRDRPEHP